MKLLLAAISPRKQSKNQACDTLLRDYTARAARYTPTETLTFPSEATLLAATERQPNRPAATLILCDSSGDLLSSQSLATLLRHHQDTATQRLLFAIGPADGWSPLALARAANVISFGRITLPHELARVILAEQIYRALTILAGHPYHSGH